MKIGQLVATLLIGLAIFLFGYWLGAKSVELGPPEVTMEINITESSGELELKPTKIELKDGSIFTDTATIYQYERIPDKRDTLAIYEDYYAKREYNRTYGTDSTYTLTLTSIVQNNRIVSEKYSDIFREKTRVEKYPIVKTPTKLGFSLEAPFNLDYIEAKAHILFKQKVDIGVGYNSIYKGVGSIGVYF